ncbi:MAG: D-alanyl-D-alanine carboxypeptidase family protein [Oscillospiraceae bacterium]|nr:D-alanyl-D-alanine carboxypeptidase family protein [Oscillospiraceae bacterium]
MKLRKLLSFIICAALLSAGPSVFAYTAYAADEFYALTGSTGEVSYDISVFANKEELSLAAPSAILVEVETGEILYEKNADERRPIASITKIMTMILVMEALETGKIALDDIVNVSEHAYRMGGSQIWLEPGEQLTVDEMLKAVAVASANDAAVALAEHVSGGEPSFVAEMNARALELGMTETTFKNSNGLDEEGHISTARDVAAMSREVLRHELVRSYITIWQDHLRGGETELTNTNKMLRSFNGITGIKTGTTSGAGVCISASAERDGMEIIAVVLGCPDSASRFASARTLLEYGFANYELAQIEIDPAALAPIEVKGGERESCALSCELPTSVVVEKGLASAVSYEISLAESLEAPVVEGQQVGTISVFAEGLKLGEYPVTAVEEVGEMTFAKGFKKLFDALCRM